MALIDQLARLAELHRKGDLTDAEFQQAKAAVLASVPAALATVGSAPTDPALVTATLLELQREQELSRIDREWELERQSLLGNHSSSAATPGHAVIKVVIALLVSVMLVMWIVETGHKVGPVVWALPAFVVCAGCYSARFTYLLAQQYEQAERDYRERRARALGGKSQNV